MTLDMQGAELALLSGLDPDLRSEIASLIARRIDEGVRTMTELALRNANLAQEGGRIGIFDIDMATGNSLGSPIWAELLGHARDTRLITRRTWIKLLHPEDRDRVLADVASMAATGANTSIDYRIVLSSGEVRWLHSRNLVTRHADDTTFASAYGTLQDMTERKTLEARVLRAAYHDDLTGLPNRRFFMERLSAACLDASPERRVGLAIYDLDSLKRANDQYGHDAGDALLKAVAERLQDVTDSQEIVARLGGDEFALLLQSDDPARLRSLAENSLVALRDPVVFRGSAISSAASVGGAVSSKRTKAPSALFRQADQALLFAKRSARGSYVQHRPRLTSSARQSVDVADLESILVTTMTSAMTRA